MPGLQVVCPIHNSTVKPMMKNFLVNYDSLFY